MKTNEKVARHVSRINTSIWHIYDKSCSEHSNIQKYRHCLFHPPPTHTHKHTYTSGFSTRKFLGLMDKFGYIHIYSSFQKFCWYNIHLRVKGVQRKISRLKIWQEPFVPGCCPSHTLKYSWVLLNCEKDSLVGQNGFCQKATLKFLNKKFTSSWWKVIWDTFYGPESDNRQLLDGRKSFSGRNWLLERKMSQMTFHCLAYFKSTTRVT